jgi:hypothetical protein
MHMENKRIKTSILQPLLNIAIVSTVEIKWARAIGIGEVELDRLGRITLTVVLGRLVYMRVPPQPPHAWYTSGIGFVKHRELRFN